MQWFGRSEAGRSRRRLTPSGQRSSSLSHHPFEFDPPSMSGLKSSFILMPQFAEKVHSLKKNWLSFRNALAWEIRSEPSHYSTYSRCQLAFTRVQRHRCAVEVERWALRETSGGGVDESEPWVGVTVILCQDEPAVLFLSIRFNPMPDSRDEGRRSIASLSFPSIRHPFPTVNHGESWGDHRGAVSPTVS